MKVLSYNPPEHVQAHVGPRGRITIYISDEKATMICVELRSKDVAMLKEAIAYAEAQTYPNPIGKEREFEAK
jgi:hypothetical protein